MGKKKVLIVDDEKPMAHALELKFSHEGFDAETAGNGVEALEQLGKGSFDLMLLDLVMPVKNGFEVLQELQKEKKSVPVIVLSNLSQSEDERKVKALGAKGFFIKAEVPIADIVEYVKQELV